MSDLFQTVTFAKETQGRARVRIMPWGVPIEHKGVQTIFDRGSIAIMAGTIPVTVDHSAGVTDRIGRVVDITDEADGLYGILAFSDTAQGRDIHTLLVDEVITDVSAGVEIDRAREYRADGLLHRAGSLAHVAVIGYGAFGANQAGSKVLAAYSQEGNMPTDPTSTPDPAPAVEPTPAPVTPPAPAPEAVTMEQYQELERQIARIQTPTREAVAARPGNFRDLQEYILTQRNAAAGNPDAAERIVTYMREARVNQGELAQFALDQDTTTTAAGIVPDYLSNEIIGLIDDFRPYVSAVASDPIGDHGMSVVYPEVVVKPDVDVQSTEGTEPATQAMDINPKSVDLATYAGASQLAVQVIERSQPSFVDRLFQEFAGVYASRTEAAAIAAAVAGAGDTAVLADFSADAAVTYAAVVAASGAVAVGIKRPGDLLVVSLDRFIELMQLVDSEGRPLVTFPGAGPSNAQGLGAISGFNFNYAGMNGIASPHAAAATAFVQWSGATATLELTPQQMRANQVGLLSVDMGVWGLFAPVVKYADGISSLTAS